MVEERVQRHWKVLQKLMESYVAQEMPYHVEDAPDVEQLVDKVGVK